MASVVPLPPVSMPTMPPPLSKTMAPESPAVGLEETITRVLVAGLVLRSGEHDLAVVGRREVLANIDLVALERVPADLFLVEFDQCPVVGELVGFVTDGDGSTWRTKPMMRCFGVAQNLVT